ncbi:DNA-binding response regulator, LuxR family protein [Formosa agariphila KMM 3901]|uniref:DNA-binding response regulator, LuxR family protein n=1 Tax=Formosa agariphila (strain DSM 15362 / KCTC 12365 / LMG 23005 / KMM 3901 / M-2Alg 35-1) TaxID=1347342 RepID=T2KNT1_FORAG|nr:response regulator transcription factor [Formosa agariphila]CDF80527.1 DNA-binding response regulator, LuxR family protein [Formosa agariphila KMM 3901]
MESTPIHVVLADDVQLFRKGICFLLERDEELVVDYEASNGKELVAYLRTSKLPDIVLTDLNMPELNGVEATKIIHKEFPDLKIVALTSYNSKPCILNMIHLGVACFLPKNVKPAELVSALKEVYSSGFYYSNEVMRFIHENLTHKGKPVKSDFDKSYLTSRELEVLSLICKQFKTSEIADKLCISPRTVEGHRNNLLLKTESKNVVGLVTYAIRNNLLNFLN